jgi:hypothetical protein
MKSDQERILGIFKTIGGICFLLAFVLALNLFTGIGRNIMALSTARFLFILLGGLGLVLNLVTYQTGRFHPLYNLVYWLGSIVTFIGLVLLLLRLPFSRWTLIAGIAIIGVSFFLPKKWVDRKEENSDLLDDQS